ncbi:MAG TPA: hypothetical protein VN223_06185, partial [Candidatus Elarobacter sp.]|nr:hypothetical protein [Candidatus Elarobacter sp.]
MTKGLALGVAVLFFCVAPGKAREESAAAQSEAQENSVARRPQARSERERADFNAAYALTGAGAEETAANDFAATYPASELRRYLYSSAMLQYQRENNPSKML